MSGAIKPRRTDTGLAPTDAQMEIGEFAADQDNGEMYYRKTNGDVVPVGGGSDTRHYLTKPAALTHTAGAVALDLSTGDWFEFTADTYTPAEITERGYTYSSQSASSLSWPIPAAAEAGDLALLASMHASSFGSVVPGLSGTTQYVGPQTTGNRSLDLWFKELTASDITAGFLYLGISGTARNHAVVGGAFTGVAMLTANDFIDQASGLGAVGGNLTSSGDGRLGLHFDTSNTYNSTAPAGWTIDTFAFANSGNYNDYLYVLTYDDIVDTGVNIGSASRGADSGYSYLMYPTGSGQIHYTINVSNLPTLITPIVLDITLDTGVGTVVFAGATVNWRGFQPDWNQAGNYRIRLLAGNGSIDAEYVYGPEDPSAKRRFGHRFLGG